PIGWTRLKRRRPAAPTPPRLPAGAAATVARSAAGCRARGVSARTRTAGPACEARAGGEDRRRRARRSTPGPRRPGDWRRSFVHLLDGAQERLALLLAQFRLLDEMQQH